MNDTMKIRLINAYANLLDVFAKNSKELFENMRFKNCRRSDYENICETIDCLGKEIQMLSEITKK